MSLELKCKICDVSVAESDKKHYWKEHKIAIADYFIKYFNKKDLLTGETISFKSVEQYLNTDFANKNNFKKWLKSQPLDKKQEYCISLLKNRIKQKNLTYAPTQTELRTLNNFPSIITYNTLFVEKDYYGICRELGLKTPYKTPSFEDINLDKLAAEIIIDTRESTPLKFEKNVEFSVQKLEYGDYAAENSPIFIERKSLNDLIGTLSSGYERFQKEIERCSAAGHYLIILCESNLNDFLSFNYLPYISKKIKVSPEYISHKIRELLHKYPQNIQFAFCNGRPEMARIIQLIFGNKEAFTEIEVQVAMDLKII